MLHLVKKYLMKKEEGGLQVVACTQIWERNRTRNCKRRRASGERQQERAFCLLRAALVVLHQPSHRAAVMGEQVKQVR